MATAAIRKCALTGPDRAHLASAARPPRGLRDPRTSAPRRSTGPGKRRYRVRQAEGRGPRRSSSPCVRRCGEPRAQECPARELAAPYSEWPPACTGYGQPGSPQASSWLRRRSCTAEQEPFLLSRAVNDGEAKGWLAGYPVDRSLYTPVAIHYTAPPILEPGTPAPVARRSGVRQGLGDTVEVPALLPAAPGIAACPVQLNGEELRSADLAALAAAVRRSPTARAIWTGERTFPDRSRGHFALAAASLGAGARTRTRYIACC